jgi:hypothetical protein
VAQRLSVKIALNVAGREIERRDVEAAVLMHQGAFHDLFSRIIDVDDSRVEVIDGSLEIDDLDYDDGATEGCADVTFMSSFYAGCRDMNSDDYHVASLALRCAGEGTFVQLRAADTLASRGGEVEAGRHFIRGERLRRRSIPALDSLLTFRGWNGIP